MRKFLALGALALCVLSFAVEAGAAGAYPSWKSIDLPWRIRSTAYTNLYVDSTLTGIGLGANIDTTISVSPPGWAVLPDSLQAVAVQIITTNPLTSGDSLYVTLEAGTGEPGSFSSTLFGGGGTTPATGRAGGFSSQACIVPVTGVTNFMLTFLAKSGGGAATSSTARAGLYAPGVMYGGWFGAPALRVKVLQTIAATPATNTYRVRLWYLSTSD